MSERNPRRPFRQCLFHFLCPFNRNDIGRVHEDFRKIEACKILVSAEAVDVKMPEPPWVNLESRNSKLETVRDAVTTREEECRGHDAAANAEPAGKPPQECRFASTQRPRKPYDTGRRESLLLLFF